ncbi:MAG: AsmA family protein [Elusimicrobia bacterium]|nr:AsmA family protein [Elusimicrobiota bacterium]
MNPSPHTARSNFRFALRVLWLLIRGFFAIFILLLVLFFLAVVLVPKVFDNEHARQTIVTQLQDILHRPVQIRSVLLSPQGVKLNGVQVFSHLEPGKVLLESESALVTVKLKPLLRRKLELNNVRLVAPHIKVWRDESGVWSITDLFPSTAAVPSATVGRLTLPVSLGAEHTVIENGTLEVDDRLKKTNIRVDRFNLSVRKFDFDRPFPLTMSFDNVSHFGGRELRASLSMEGSMSLASQNWPEAYIRAERLEAKIDGHMVRGSAGMNDFTQPVVDAELLLPALGAAEWQGYLNKTLDLTLPPSRWRAKVELTGPQQFKVVQLRVSAGPITASAAGSLDMSGPKPRLDVFAMVSDFPLDALAAYRSGASRFHLKGTASGEAGASGWTDRLVVHRAKLHLRDLTATLKNSTIEKGDIDVSAANDFYNFSASVSRGAVSAFGNSFTDIGGSVSVAGQDLSLDGVSLKWGESKVRLKARVVNLSKPKEVELSGNIDRLRWEKAQQLVNGMVASVANRPAPRSEAEEAKHPWVQTFKYVIPRKFPDTIGHFKVGSVTHQNFEFRNTDFLWDVRGVTPSLQGVSGDIRVGFGPGRVNDIQAVQDSNKFLRIVFLPYIYMHKLGKLAYFSTHTAFPKTLDFTRIEGQYTITQGVVTTHFTHVDSPQTIAFADGTADFGRERVNMNILTRLTTYSGMLPEWWMDEKGRPAIGFRVTGDLGHPDLEPRLRKIGESEIEDQLAQGRSRAATRFVEIEKLKTLEEAKP